MFLGAKEIGRQCLEILFQKQESLGFEILAVGTSPRGVGVREFARAKGIPIIQDLDALLGLQFEILFSVQYHAILKKEHIACAREIAFNLHLAPLPQYRGCNAFSFAILNEDREFGVTIHRLEEGIDGGDIAFSRRFEIPSNCFVDELVELANAEGFKLFCENLEKMLQGEYGLIPQDSIKASRREFHLRSEIEALKCVDLQAAGGGGFSLKKSFAQQQCPDLNHPIATLEKENSTFYKQSKIRDVKMGKNVVVVEPCNLYECELFDNVFVGPFVEIQKGVRIGANTRVQSHSFICELVSIGESCFIGHGVMFINDVFEEGCPAGGNVDLWKETKIGNNVSIGSNATILPVSICDGAVIGAGSVVTKNLTKKGVYAGNPAKLIREL